VAGKTPTVLAGRYQRGALIGTGASSAVYRAFDQRLQRTVAVKCLSSPQWSTARGRARFEAEARTAAAMVHPRVVSVFDVGVDDDTAFLVLESLPGSTFADEIARGPVSVDRTRFVISEVLDGLGAAHAQGLLHRDIKPSNVLTTGDGHIKLADFGIATSPGREPLTETGMVIGTPEYLAPERLRGERATVSTDLYAVGVMGYEALAGHRPFTGDSPVAVAYAVMHTPVPRLRETAPAVPDALAAVVARAMARAPEERFESADEFAAALAASEDAPATHAAALAPTVAVQLPTNRRGDTAELPVAPRSRRTLRLGAALTAVVVLLLAGTLFAAFDRTGGHRAAPPLPSPTTVSLPAPLRAPFERLQQAITP
jgi:serine/threonine protein kinase